MTETDHFGRRERLAVIIKGYCKEVSERCVLMQTYAQGAFRGDEEARRIFSLQTHSLAGSGVTMGFADLSEAAALMEKALVEQASLSELEHKFKVLQGCADSLDPAAALSNIMGENGS